MHWLLHWCHWHMRIVFSEVIVRHLEMRVVVCAASGSGRGQWSHWSHVAVLMAVVERGAFVWKMGKDARTNLNKIEIQSNLDFTYLNFRLNLDFTYLNFRLNLEFTLKNLMTKFKFTK